MYPYSPPRRGGAGGGGANKTPLPGDQKDRLWRFTPLNLGDSKRGMPLWLGAGDWSNGSGVAKGWNPFGWGLGTAGPQMYPYSPPRRGGGGGGGLIRHPCLGDQNDRLLGGTPPSLGFSRGVAPCAGVVGTAGPQMYPYSPPQRGGGGGGGLIRHPCLGDQNDRLLGGTPPSLGFSRGDAPFGRGCGDRRSPNVPLLPSPKGRGWGRGANKTPFPWGF